MVRRSMNDVIVPKNRPLKSVGTSELKAIENKLKEIEELKKTEEVKEIVITKKFPPLDPVKQKKFPPLPPRVPHTSPGLLENQFVWWFLGVVTFSLIVYFVFPAFFSGAKISITPKKVDVPFESSFTGTKSKGDLPFEIMSLKGSETIAVPATGIEKITRRASGKIIIYNNYSKDSQKLLATTRFATSEGKIYRIQNEVTVPGTTLRDGATVPGSIEATVYADKAGSEYNIGLTDFTIPGFKGDPRFSKFYARSKTEMSGGYSGTLPVASEKDGALAEIDLKKTLTESLVRQSQSQIPSGYILYAGAFDITFKESEPVGTATTTLTLKKEAVLTGVLLNKEKLSKKILEKNKISTTTILGYEISNIEKLIFKPVSPITPGMETISYTLAGPLGITYIVDTDALIEDLLGTSKRNFTSVIAGQEFVTEAHIVFLRPFWVSAFPENKEKITIVLEPTL